MSVLNVLFSQVIGDETLALDSVLECDTVRADLLKKEKELTAAMNSGYNFRLVLFVRANVLRCSSSDPEISNELSEVYAQLQNIEADKAPAKASIILNGLGFTSDMQRQPTKTFSGGWRMRLALARALFSRCCTKNLCMCC